MKTRYIHEHVVGGQRLGRHIEHDPRSKNFTARHTVFGSELRTTKHRRYGSVLDQGSVGSCTGNACAGALNTLPLHIVGRNFHEKEAVELYSLATSIDEFDGSYPPNDTGSSGLAAAKAAKQKGYISSYAHAFGIDQALAALQVDPVLTGVNWYEGFDTPDVNGLVKLEGQIRGGHEFEIIDYFYNPDDPSLATVGCVNSWGHQWGIRGKFYMYVRDWATLLEADGDVTVLYS